MPPAPRLATPTSHDVAQEAGLSQSTVSRALRGDTRVTAETRERVLAAAQRLGYTPSALGRNLVQRSTRTIGMVVTEISNPFYPNLIAPLHDELAELGYRMALFTERLEGEQANPLDHLEGLFDQLRVLEPSFGRRPVQRADHWNIDPLLYPFESLEVLIGSQPELVSLGKI